MKSARHAMIYELVNSIDVETQDELAALLKERGFVVTQATVSRDIKELRLVKTLTHEGRYKYIVSETGDSGLQNRFATILSHSFVSIERSGNIIVIKTLTGTAGAAAEAIDSLKWKEILGSVAGDNAIFIVIREDIDADELIERFKSLIK